MGPSAHRVPRQLPLAALLAGLLAAACGSSNAGSSARAQHARPAPAARAAGAFCALARRSARRWLGAPVAVQVADTDPAYTECVLRSRGLSVDVVAQGAPQARSAYDVAIAHYTQNYGEPGGLRDPSQLPQEVPGIGSDAAWVPGPRRFIATNATSSIGGDFLSVTLSPQETPVAFAKRLTRHLAEVLLPAAPRGPNLRSDY